MKISSKYFKNQYCYINRNKIYSLIILFLSLFITIGYAYLNTLLNINGTLKITKNTWDVHFENIEKINGSIDATLDAVISDDTNINFTISLQNPGDFYGFSVDIVNDGTIDAMLNEILKTGLTTSQEVYIDYVVTYSDGEEILPKDSLPSGEKDTILIFIKYKDDILTEQFPTEDQSIILNLNMEYVQSDDSSNNRRPVIYLYDRILKQNQENGLMVLDNEASSYVSSTTGIDFALAPSETNGKGIYVRSGTENSKYPIYYYRGNVDNNNLIFAGFCWKIVRTTETGGIKLIYNGVASNGICDNTGISSQINTVKFNSERNYNAFVGYMYGTVNSSDEHKNNTNSLIKGAIDTWYVDNMLQYTKYLEDTVWCNDRSFANGNTGTGVGTSNTNYGPYERNITSSNPSLECINLNDRFTVDGIIEGRINGNGALTYPAALLTADELTLAGQGNTGYSTANYLYTGQFYWSLSPGYFSNNYAYNIYVDTNGSLVSTYSVAANARGIRPAISLKQNTVINVNGDGTKSNPYVVIEN